MKKIIVSLCAVAAIAFTTSAFASDAPSTDGLPAASLAASAKWSTITFAPAVADQSVATLVLNVTDDATLTFDGTVALSNLYFNISSGKTLTIATNSTGVVTLTGSMIAFGGGTIAADFLPLSGKFELVNTPFVLNNPCEIRAIQVQENGSMKFAEGASFTLYENMTFADSATLAVGNKTDFLDFGGSQTVITSEETLPAASCFTCSGTGVGYSVARTDTKLSLSCAAVADASDAGIAATATTTPQYSGFLSSASTKGTDAAPANVYGPSTTYPNAYRLTDGGTYANLAGRTSAFSFAIYADVSKMSSTSKSIIASFGTNLSHTDTALVLYRDGTNVKLAFIKKTSDSDSTGTIVGTAATVDISSVAAGFHLWTAVCDPTTGDLALCLDNGTAQAGGASQAVTLGTGFQIGAVYQGRPSDFNAGVGLAYVALNTYDGELSASKVAALSTTYPYAAAAPDPILRAGDEVMWANTDANNSNIGNGSDTAWSLTLPPRGGSLPVGATVKVTSIAIAAREGESDKPTKLRLYKSSADGDYYTTKDVVEADNVNLGAGGGYGKKLYYEFNSPGVEVAVGTTYTIKPMNSSAEAKLGARLVQSANNALIINGAPAYTTLYEIKGTVVSASAAPGYFATLNGTPATSLSFTENVHGGSSDWAYIDVVASTTLTLDSAVSSYSKLTFNVAEGATLTIANAGSTCATNEVIGAGTVVLQNAAGLTGVLVGDGNVTYSGAFPSGLTPSGTWTGNIKFTNYTTKIENFKPGLYGNSLSTITLNGINGYFPNVNPNYCFSEIILEDDGDTPAFSMSDGSANSEYVLAKVSGSGTLGTSATTSANHLLRIWDYSDFTGSIAASGTGTNYKKRFVLGFGPACDKSGSITISDGEEYTIPNGKMLKLQYVCVSNSVVNASTAGAISGQIIGNGDVVYTGCVPTDTTAQNGLKSADWTGNLLIKDYHITSGSGTSLNVFGNGRSTISFSGTELYYLNNSDSSSATINLIKDENYTYALKVNDGSSSSVSSYGALRGDGLLYTVKSTVQQLCTFTNAIEFTGSITNNGRALVIGDSIKATSNDYRGLVKIDSGRTLGLGDGSYIYTSSDNSAHKIQIDGTLIVHGAGSLDAPVTLSDGATLVFNGLTAEKKLTLSAAPTFASGTVNVTLGAGVTPAEGMKLISWPEGSVPAGTFQLTNESDLKLQATATGVVFAKKANPVIFLVR